MPSLFKNAFSQNPEQSMSLGDIRRAIIKADTTLKQSIELLRIEPDETAQAKMKKMLPAVAFSGEFSARNSEALEIHTGLYLYDLDHVNANKAKALVEYIDSLAIAFTSPRGNGLKVVLRGPKGGDHRRNWETGKRIVEDATHMEVDASGSDVCRLCFLSSDRNLIDGPGVAFQTAEREVTIEDMPAPKSSFDEYKPHTVREMLWRIGSELSYDKWRNIIWAVVSHLGKNSETHDMLLEWSRECGGEKSLKSREDERAFEAIYKSNGDGITFATLIAEAHKAGWTDWRRMLRRDEDGKIIHDESNLMIVLTHHPDFRGRLWCDAVTRQMWMDPIATPSVCEGSKHGGLIEDSLAAWVLYDIQAELGYGFRGAKNVGMLMASIASVNLRNKRKEWLESLSWDGVPRLGRLFIDAFRAEDCEMNEALARAFLGGAVARILRPGASVQVVPILVGRQGCGKSQGIKALCPDTDWFCDSFIDFDSKSGYEVVQHASIVELCELSAVKRADVEKVKQFLTQGEVRFRAPYDKQAKSHPATWVFIGTTNEEQFLKDQNGNRRFAPVYLSPKCDSGESIPWVRKYRDQLWAEAVDMVARGLKEGREAWHVPPKYWEELEAQASKARERDPWEDEVSEYTERLIDKYGKCFRSLREIVVESGLQLRGRSDELLLGKLLRQLGWKRKSTRIGKNVAYRWHISG